jgi:hypothetical protein
MGAVSITTMRSIFGRVIGIRLHPEWGISAGVRITPEWVNDNPVYDAARRFTREHVKILGRRQFVSYEVAGGKSILRFLRYVNYPGIDADTLDCFKGIAPPKDAASH